MKKVTFLFITLMLSAYAYAQGDVQAAVATKSDTTNSTVVVSSIVTYNLRGINPSLTVNATQLIGGNIAGVYTSSTSGQPGAAANIIIRGTNSFNENSEPYYLVDGFPMTASQLSAVSILDIESITVLKDAAATAIYGIYGGNGVVIIKTKQGAKDPFRVTFSAEAGVANVLNHNFDLMNTTQKLDYELDAGFINQQIYNERKPYDYNHVDEIFHSAWMQQYNLQLSGGNERINYLVSGNYYAQDGTLDASSFKRYTGRANVNGQVTKWLKAGINLSFGTETNLLPNISGNAANPVFASLMLNPYTRLRNDDGSINPIPENPLFYIQNYQNTVDYTYMAGSAFLDFSLAPQLHLKSSIHINNSKEEGNYYSDLTYDPDFNIRITRETQSKQSSLIQTNELSYSFHLPSNEKHGFEFKLAEEYQYGKRKDSINSRTNYSYSENSLENRISRMSFMANASYNFNNKYFVDINYRLDNYDNSSVLDRVSNSSWSLAAKWDMHNEGFIREIQWIDILRVRGNYGTSAYINNSNNIGNNIIIPVKMYNVGLDIAVLNTQLTATIDVYRKTTDGTPIIMELFSPPASIVGGSGEVQNQGLEVTLGWNVMKKDYHFALNANFGINQNEILSLTQYSQPVSELWQGNYEGLKVGSSAGNFVLPRWAGVNSINGQPLWLTQDGSLTSFNNYENNVFIDGKSHIPSKAAGLNIVGGYKGFSLSALFCAVWDVWALNENLYYLKTSNGYFDNQYNMVNDANNYWRQSGDQTELPALREGAIMDTRILQNHSYLRLKNVTLSYDFSKKMMNETKILYGARIYVSAQNLFTITNYECFDPDFSTISDIGVYPVVVYFRLG